MQDAMKTAHLALGAVLAADGIPLHYGDQAGEYAAALSAAVLMERSHEGRLTLNGRDRLALLQRISTNNVESLAENTGAPTIFTNPNGRIIDRVTVFNRGQSALLLSEPGRGGAVRDYLKRNIFFNDDVQLEELAESHQQFNLHGVNADRILNRMFPSDHPLELWQSRTVSVNAIEFVIGRVKPLAGSHYVMIVPTSGAEQVWSALINSGKPDGLRAAGSLTYNALRIRAGRPGVGRELSLDYIPLEVGLWDEISFTKGCYTGQEIIARMESRQRLAKTIVALDLSAMVDAPAPLKHDGREIGRLTSSVTAPNGVRYAIGVVKVALSRPGTVLEVDTEVTATVTARLGVQPDHLEDEN